MSELRSSDEKIFMEGRCSRDIANTLRYMKDNGWDNIGTVRMNGKNRAILTMREEYYDDDVSEILEKMCKIWKCCVYARWGE